MDARTLVDRIVNHDALPPVEAAHHRLLFAGARLLEAAGDRAAVEELLPDARTLARQAGAAEEMIAALERPEAARLALVIAGLLAPIGDEASVAAAARLLESSLAATPPDGGAAIALRLVRLYQELDRPDDVVRAYAQAIARSPLASWLVPPSSIGPEAERVEREAIASSIGSERTLREAIEAFRRGAGALVRLEDIAEDPELGAGASLLIVCEELRAAAALDPARDRSALHLALAHVRSHAHALQAFGPLAPLARALVAILAGDRAQAVDALASGLPRVDGDPTEAAAAIADALERELRTPPHRADEILRRAFFEALVDPFSAFDPPRSAFAKLRHWIAGAALGLAVTTAAMPSIAEADTPADGVELVHEEAESQLATVEMAVPVDLTVETPIPSGVDVPAEADAPPPATAARSGERRGGWRWGFHFRPRAPVAHITR